MRSEPPWRPRWASGRRRRSPRLHSTAPRQGCNLVDCDRLCRTLGYPGGLCSRGSCFCYR